MLSPPRRPNSAPSAIDTSVPPVLLLCSLRTSRIAPLPRAPPSAAPIARGSHGFQLLTAAVPASRCPAIIQPVVWLLRLT